MRRHRIHLSRRRRPRIRPRAQGGMSGLSIGAALEGIARVLRLLRLLLPPKGSGTLPFRAPTCLPWSTLTLFRPIRTRPRRPSPTRLPSTPASTQGPRLPVFQLKSRPALAPNINRSDRPAAESNCAKRRKAVWEHARGRRAPCPSAPGAPPPWSTCPAGAERSGSWRTRGGCRRREERRFRDQGNEAPVKPLRFACNRSFVSLVRELNMRLLEPELIPQRGERALTQVRKAAPACPWPAPAPAAEPPRNQP